MPHERQPLAVRFWKKVNKTETCWLWTGAQMGKGWETKAGYGLIRVDAPARGTIPAHRASWEIHNGPIPAGQLVLHKCDVHPCVNPAHLFLGTHTDNTQDMLAKKRWPGVPTWKLNPHKVRFIRLANERKIPVKHIARHVGVTRAQVYRVINGESWSGVS